MLSLFRSIMQAVIDNAVPYLHMREAFGQKIGQFQVWSLTTCIPGRVLLYNVNLVISLPWQPTLVLFMLVCS